jgi:hypothetical protein
MPAVNAALCCQHVSGFRYADDMFRLAGHDLGADFECAAHPADCLRCVHAGVAIGRCPNAGATEWTSCSAAPPAAASSTDVSSPSPCPITTLTTVSRCPATVTRAASIWAMLSPAGISRALRQRRSVNCSTGAHRHDGLILGGVLGLGLRLLRSDGDREPGLCAAQGVALEGQVRGHHLCEAGDRGRRTTRTDRWPGVAGHGRDRRSRGRARSIEHVGLLFVLVSCRSRP